MRKAAPALLMTFAISMVASSDAYAEIAWQMNKKHHVGMVVGSPSYERVQQLMAEYPPRFANDFVATVPPMNSPAG